MNHFFSILTPRCFSAHVAMIVLCPAVDCHVHGSLDPTTASVGGGAPCQAGHTH